MLMVCRLRLSPFLTLFLLIGCQCHEASAQKSEKVTLAVTDFRIATGVTSQGQKIDIETAALTDKLVTALVNTHKVDVVERQRLEALMKELDLSESGLVASAHLQRMKEMAGADYYLFGSIATARFGVCYEPIPYVQNRFTRTVSGHIVADMRLVETQTGRIVCARRGEVQQSLKDATTSNTVTRASSAFADSLERALVDELVQYIIDSCYPMKVVRFTDGVAYLNRGRNFGLESGVKLQSYCVGEALTDPDTKEVLGSEEQKRATLEVVEVAEKFAKARVVSWEEEECDLTNTICRHVADVRQPIPAPRGNEQNNERKRLPQW